MDKRILLVGGTGYLGRNLRQSLLNNKFSVYTTGTKTTKDPKQFVIDFDQPNTFKSLDNLKFDIILLLASKIDSIKTNSLNHSDLNSNVLGFGKFLEYLKNNRVGDKLIYISSMTVYSRENISPVIETGKLAPSHTYGLSKFLAEYVFEFFCKSAHYSGVVMRLPGIYGGDRKNGFIFNLIKRFTSKENIQLNSTGLGFWETIHIEDLNQMIIEFLKKYEWSKEMSVFNISYGEETDFYDTAKLISQVMKCENLLSIDPEKDYDKLFLSNKKISFYATPPMSFKKRLKRYIKTHI